MSNSTPNTSLSLSARLLCYLGPPSAILLTAAASPRTALLSPIALLPSALCYREWRKSDEADPFRRAELEPLIWTFAAGGTLGLAAAALFQLAVFKASSPILFRSNRTMEDDFWKEFLRSTLDGITPTELARRAELSSSWQNWAWMIALSFIGAGFGEEIIKYLPIICARRRGTAKDRQRRNRSYIDYVFAAALSFSMVEAIGFLYATVTQGDKPWTQMAFTILERVPGQVGHVAVSLLTALRATRRDYYGEKLNWWSVVGPAALLHGAADFVLFAGSALDGNVGFIHPTGFRKTVVMLGGYLALVTGTVWQVRKEWKDLDDRDIAREASASDSAEK